MHQYSNICRAIPRGPVSSVPTQNFCFYLHSPCAQFFFPRISQSLCTLFSPLKYIFDGLYCCRLSESGRQAIEEHQQA